MKTAIKIFLLATIVVSCASMRVQPGKLDGGMWLLEEASRVDSSAFFSADTLVFYKNAYEKNPPVSVNFYKKTKLFSVYFSNPNRTIHGLYELDKKSNKLDFIFCDHKDSDVTSNWVELQRIHYTIQELDNSRLILV